MGDIIIQVFMLVSAVGILGICFVVWLNRRQSEATEVNYNTDYNPRAIFEDAAKHQAHAEPKAVASEQIS